VPYKSQQYDVTAYV